MRFKDLISGDKFVGRRKYETAIKTNEVSSTQLKPSALPSSPSKQHLASRVTETNTTTQGKFDLEAVPAGLNQARPFSSYSRQQNGGHLSNLIDQTRNKLMSANFSK
jgi:hypothetical protein